MFGRAFSLPLHPVGAVYAKRLMQFAAPFTTRGEWWQRAVAPTIGWRPYRREPNSEPAMRQTQSESNLDDLVRRKSRRTPGLIAAGLIMAAIGAVAVLNQPAERGQTSVDFAVANAASRLLTVPTQDAASGERARAIVEGLKSHFERSDEPAAAEDSTKPYGG